jgi:hypothetical protein
MTYRASLPYVQPIPTGQSSQIVGELKKPEVEQTDEKQQVVTPDLEKYIELGDGTFVDRESFNNLQEDTKKAGLNVGLDALKTSIQQHKDNYDKVVNDLKPYTDESGKVNLAQAIKDNKLDVNLAVSEKIFDQNAIDNAKVTADALTKIQDYTVKDSSGKTSYDIAKYLKNNPQDLQTLKTLGVSDSVVSQAQNYNVALEKIQPFSTEVNGKILYNTAEFLKANPNDTQTLKELGMSDADISNVKSFNVAVESLKDYATKNEQGQTVYNIADYLTEHPNDTKTLLTAGIKQEDINNVVQGLSEINTAQSLIQSIAQSKNIQISDVKKLSDSEIKSLLDAGVDANSIARAGQDVGQINSVVESINLERTTKPSEPTSIQLTQSQQDLLAESQVLEGRGVVGQQPIIVLPEGFVGAPAPGEIRAETIKESLAKQGTPLPDGAVIISYDRSTGSVSYSIQPKQLVATRTDATNDIESLMSNGYDSKKISYYQSITDATKQLGYYDAQKLNASLKSIGWVDTTTNKLLTEQDIAQRQWDSLTQAQKDEVADIYGNDAFKGNYLSESYKIGEGIVAESGIVGQLTLGAPLMIVRPVALATTGQKVTVGDVATSAGMAILTGLSMGGAGALSSLGAVGSRVATGLDIGITGGFATVQTKDIITNISTMTPTERNTAIAMDALMLAGMGLGVKGFKDAGKKAKLDKTALDAQETLNKTLEEKPIDGLKSDIKGINQDINIAKVTVDPVSGKIARNIADLGSKVDDALTKEFVYEQIAKSSIPTIQDFYAGLKDKINTGLIKEYVTERQINQAIYDGIKATGKGIDNALTKEFIWEQLVKETVPTLIKETGTKISKAIDTGLTQEYVWEQQAQNLISDAISKTKTGIDDALTKEYILEQMAKQSIPNVKETVKVVSGALDDGLTKEYILEQQVSQVVEQAINDAIKKTGKGIDDVLTREYALENLVSKYVPNIGAVKDSANGIINTALLKEYLLEQKISGAIPTIEEIREIIGNSVNTTLIKEYILEQQVQSAIYSTLARAKDSSLSAFNDVLNREYFLEQMAKSYIPTTQEIRDAISKTVDAALLREYLLEQKGFQKVSDITNAVNNAIDTALLKEYMLEQKILQHIPTIGETTAKISGKVDYATLKDYPSQKQIRDLIIESVRATGRGIDNLLTREYILEQMAKQGAQELWDKAKTKTGTAIDDLLTKEYILEEQLKGAIQDGIKKTGKGLDDALTREYILEQSLRSSLPTVQELFKSIKNGIDTGLIKESITEQQIQQAMYNAIKATGKGIDDALTKEYILEELAKQSMIDARVKVSDWLKTIEVAKQTKPMRDAVDKISDEVNKAQDKLSKIQTNEMNPEIIRDAFVDVRNAISNAKEVSAKFKDSKISGVSELSKFTDDQINTIERKVNSLSERYIARDAFIKGNPELPSQVRTALADIYKAFNDKDTGLLRDASKRLYNLSFKIPKEFNGEWIQDRALKLYQNANEFINGDIAKAEGFEGLGDAIDGIDKYFERNKTETKPLPSTVSPIITENTARIDELKATLDGFNRDTGKTDVDAFVKLAKENKLGDVEYSSMNPKPVITEGAGIPFKKAEQDAIALENANNRINFIKGMTRDDVLFGKNEYTYGKAVDTFGKEQVKLVYPKLTDKMIEDSRELLRLIDEDIKSRKESYGKVIASAKYLGETKEVAESLKPSKLSGIGRGDIPDRIVLDSQSKGIKGYTQSDIDLINAILSTKPTIEKSGLEFKIIPTENVQALKEKYPVFTNNRAFTNDNVFLNDLYTVAEGHFNLTDTGKGSFLIEKSDNFRQNRVELPIVKNEEPFKEMRSVLEGDVYKISNPDDLSKAIDETNPNRIGLEWITKEEFEPSEGNYFVGTPREGLGVNIPEKLTLAEIELSRLTGDRINELPSYEFKQPIVKLTGATIEEQSVNLVNEISEFVKKDGIANAIDKYGISAVEAIYPYARDYAEAEGGGFVPESLFGKPPEPPKTAPKTDFGGIGTLESAEGLKTRAMTPEQELALRGSRSGDLVVEPYIAPKTITQPIPVPSEVPSIVPESVPETGEQKVRYAEDDPYHLFPIKEEPQPSEVSTSEPTGVPSVSPTPTSIPSSAPSPSTVPSSVPTPSPVPVPTPQPVPQPQPQPLPMPQPVPVPTPTPTPIPLPQPLPLGSRQEEKKRVSPKGLSLSEDKEAQQAIIDNAPEGTIIVLQGRPQYKGETTAPMFKVLVPPYDEFFTTRQTPKGYVDEGFTGKGSAFKSVQIIGKLDKPVRNVDLGFVKVDVDIVDGKPVISYAQDESSNSGERSMTVGMGKGQIPIEEWDKAKSEGVSYEDFIASYQGEKVGEYDSESEPETETIEETEPEVEPEIVVDNAERFDNKVKKQDEGMKEVASNFEPPVIINGLDKKLKYQFGKRKVYAVDTHYLRNILSKKHPELSEFDGGNWKVYPDLIPENEIWVDSGLKRQDFKTSAIHYIIQADAMGEGKYKGDEYDLANQEITPIDVYATDNPNYVDRMLSTSLQGKYESLLEESSRYKEKPIEEEEQSEVFDEVDRMVESKPRPAPVKGWWEESNEIETGLSGNKYYRGRRLLPPNIGGNL